MSSLELRKHLLEVVNSAAPKILSRAKAGQFEIVDCVIRETSKGYRVESMVIGTQPYDVTIGERFSQDHCDCPYFQEQNEICKHLVGVALHAVKLLKNEPIQPQKKATQEVALKTESRLPEKVEEPMRYTFRTKKDLDYQHWSLVPIWQGIESRFSILRKQGPKLLPPLDKAICELMPQGYPAFSKQPEQPRSLFAALGLLAQTGTLIHPKTKLPMTIHTDLHEPRLVIQSKPDGGARLSARIENAAHVIAIEKGAVLFGLQEFALWQGQEIYAINAMDWMNEYMPMLLQQQDLDADELKQLMPLIRDNPHLFDVSDDLQPRTLQVNATPVLLMRFNKNSMRLRVQLCFRYPPAEGLHPYSSKAETLHIQLDTQEWASLEKSPKQEMDRLQEIYELYKNQAWIALLEYNCLELDRYDIPRWIRFIIDPLLKNPEWEIHGLEELNTFRQREATVKIRVGSGIDWFELQGGLDFEGQHVTLADILKNSSKDYYTLPDGSQGKIPWKIQQLLRIVQGLQEKKSDQELRISSLHQNLLQSLLDDESIDPGEREPLRNTLLHSRFCAIPEREVPKSLHATLRSYQAEGLHWLRQMRAWGTGGILADDMGLGKTVQVISCLCDYYEDQNEKSPTIIVMPTSLIHNWKYELERFAPHLPVIVHHGMQRESLQERAIPPQAIILTTYTLLRNEIDFWKSLEFGYAILDEAQAIKNATSQSLSASRALRAKHRLSMTGTPVENHLMDLWSQFAFLNPGLLGNREFFQREFAKPAEQDSSHAMDLLRRLIAPFYLRRTKEKVLKDLPPLEERVLYVDMGDAQRKFYEKTKVEFRKKILAEIENKGIRKAQIHIIEGMLRLRQIACDPRLYKKTAKIPSAKLELLVDKLKEDLVEHHKALVFSQFTTLLDYCGKALQEANIEYVYLDGSTRDRASVIKEFTNAKHVKVFLISLKAGGSGLNLVAADYVFHLDPWWNPAVEAQATGRAHRIGQTQTVQSVKMVVSNSIEEKILQLQDSKRKLAAQVISSDQGLVQSLDIGLVRELFG